MTEKQKLFAYWITGPHYFYVPQPNAESANLDKLVDHAKATPQIVLKDVRPGNDPPLNNPYGMVVNLS